MTIDTNDSGSEVITRLLEQTLAGSTGAANALLDEVYTILHELADQQLRGENRQGDLQATALVNEAYVRVFGGKPIAFENRRHLFRIFALAMREVLIDSARRRNAQKRKHKREDLHESRIASPVPKELKDVVALDNVLPQLDRRDERASEIVRLKCFAGLTDRQIAEVTGLSQRTVQREWNFARAFLRREIAKGAPDER
ncbi:MAG: ECF-type sigma factor [Myxococcota bacterium]